MKSSRQLKNMRVWLVAAAALVTVTACSSKPEPTPYDIPAWYTQVQTNDEYFYGRGDGQSNRLGTAERQARLAALTDLATAVRADVRALLSQGAETDVETNTTMGVSDEAMEAAISASITGAELDQVSYVPMPDGTTRAFVRLRMPKEQAEKIGQSALEYMRENVPRPGQ